MTFKQKNILAHAILLSVIAILCIISVKDACAEIILNLHVASYHSGSDGWWSKETGELEEYNQFNPGLGISYQFNDYTEVRGGGYRNSHNNNSFYFGGAVYTNSNNLLGAGVVGGFVTGYNDLILNADFEHEAVQPFVMPALFINHGRVRVEVGYIPSLADGMADTLTLTTGIRF